MIEKEKHIHFDCPDGVSSDMILGALIRLGADGDDVAKVLRGVRAAAAQAGLGAPEFNLNLKTMERNGISGYVANIEIIGAEHTPRDGATHSSHSNHAHGHTSYTQIKKMLEFSDISEGAKKYVCAAYDAIATAEGIVHGMPKDEASFHEVGSARTVYTVVATAIAAELVAGRYGVTGFTCGTLTDGSGAIVCSHGTIPVPVPAVKELLKLTDIRLVSDPSVNTEMVTPSGLGLLIGLGCRYSPQNENQSLPPHHGGSVLSSHHAPQKRPEKTGFGFGMRDTGRTGAVRAALY